MYVFSIPNNVTKFECWLKGLIKCCDDLCIQYAFILIVLDNAAGSSASFSHLFQHVLVTVAADSYGVNDDCFGFREIDNAFSIAYCPICQTKDALLEVFLNSSFLLLENLLYWSDNIGAT